MEQATKSNFKKKKLCREGCNLPNIACIHPSGFSFYYFKKGDKKWKIEKRSFGIRGTEVYKSMAKRCVFKVEVK